VTPDADLNRYGAVFDTVAAEYDLRRPTYPEELIDHACRLGGVSAGDRVLEIGCGTGRLTRSLVARGLQVTAVEPGENLIALATEVEGPGAVRFVNRRFEDARVEAGFAAIFSASAWHWIDPDVSWDKAARLLAPGGLLALIQYCGGRDESTAADADALMSALAEAAPEIAVDWPVPRDVETILSGATERRSNVSDVWAWVARQAVARSYAAGLFDEVEIAVQPTPVEQTAEELNALFRTTSVCHRLSPAQREALVRANEELGERLGRPFRTSMVAVLVTARRAPGA
jgi:SAM-dependent methyltransferase